MLSTVSLGRDTPRRVGPRKGRPASFSTSSGPTVHGLRQERKAHPAPLLPPQSHSWNAKKAKLYLSKTTFTVDI